MSKPRKYNAGNEVATPKTMHDVVDYLQRLKHAGQLRAVAVVYVDPNGRDYSLYAVQHLDQTGAAGIARGMKQLAALLKMDAI